MHLIQIYINILSLNPLVYKPQNLTNPASTVEKKIKQHMVSAPLSNVATN